MGSELFITRDSEGSEIANIAAMVEQRALRQPAAPALIMKEAIVSYRALQQAVNAVAAKLLASGIVAGQMVGISMAQTPMHVFTMLALARIGVPFVSIHPTLPQERRMMAVRRYAVTALISGRADCRLEGLPFILLGHTDLRTDIAPVPYAATLGDTSLRIAQSSGTSGDPKGVMLTHGHIRARMGLTSYGVTPASRVLVMDLNFAANFNYALCALALGAAIVFADSHAPDDQIDAVRRFAVTDWMLSPAIAESIAAHLTEDDIHFATVTQLRIIGASPSAKLIDTLFKRFTPHVHVAYGLTEMGTVAVAAPEVLKRRPGTVGRLAPETEGQGVDEQDRPLPAGHSGILRLRSDSMPQGYYPDNGLTAERFRDGWYYPRDMARFDEDGLLFIEGRQDDVLNVGGIKVQFRDVEQVFEAHPGIREAAVFVAIDSEGREKMGLAYISRDGSPIDGLDAFGERKLGPLRPGIHAAVRELPRTLTGKVLREQLKTLYLGDGLR